MNRMTATGLIDRMRRYGILELLEKSAPAIRLSRVGLEVRATFSDKIDQPTYDFLTKAANTAGVQGICKAWTEANMVSQGPKVFRPTARQCEAMENIEINIPFQEYAQPFPVLVIEFPGDYFSNRLVKIPGVEASFDMTPHLAIVGWDIELRMISVVLVGEDARAITNLIFDGGSDAPIDQALNKSSQWADEFKGLVSPGEVFDTDDAMVKMDRTALNACLALMHFGHTAEAQNNDHMARLTRHLQVANRKKDTRLIQNTQREMRLHPTILSFAQEVVLSVDQRHAGGLSSDGHSGIQMSPHWRRGCWVQQPFGPQSSLRKRIFRPAVLVNLEFLAGPLSGTSVTYREARQPEERPCRSCAKKFLAIPGQDLCSDECRRVDASARNHEREALFLSSELEKRTK